MVWMAKRQQLRDRLRTFPVCLHHFLSLRLFQPDSLIVHVLQFGTERRTRELEWIQCEAASQTVANRKVNKLNKNNKATTHTTVHRRDLVHG